jgi:hypothetical protein
VQFQHVALASMTVSLDHELLTFSLIRNTLVSNESQVFTFKVLEELEQKPDQSEAEFMEDLKTLEQLCRANLDESKEY